MSLAVCIGPSPSRVVLDPEHVLMDPIIGVHKALLSVARACRVPPGRVPAPDILRRSNLQHALVEIAGGREQSLLMDLSRHYAQVYHAQARFEVPLRPGAGELLSAVIRSGAKLSAVSTLGTRDLERLLEAHQLLPWFEELFTPPEPVCPGARHQVLERWMSLHPGVGEEVMLISESPRELFSAGEQGMGSIALSLGLAPEDLLNSIRGVVAIAEDLDEVRDSLPQNTLPRPSVGHVPGPMRARLH